MPGPLPNEQKRRRNAPTIPTTNLPISGRTGDTPKVPSWVRLGKAGKAWWMWAWRTPQACGWGTKAGQEVVVARRASLEDDLAALDTVHGLDMLDVSGDDAETVKMAVRHLAGLATGRLAIVREMRELDKVLGLTPKGMADLRWKIVDDQPAKGEQSGTGGSASSSGRWSGLRVVESA